MQDDSKKLEKRLVELGGSLASPPSSVDELYELLDQIDGVLSSVEQSPSQTMLTALRPLMTALAVKDLLRHSDLDVKAVVASCISEITRITAPEAPYDDDNMKEIFQMIVETFEGLDKMASRSFQKRVSILETVAKVGSCIVMLDLECDALILEMFHNFLKTIRTYHSENVFSCMETIMTLVIEESEDISTELLSILLDTLRNDKKDVLSIAQSLAEKVMGNCASKIKPCLLSLVRSKGAPLSEYHKVVASICQENDMLDHYGANAAFEAVADVSKLTERTSLDEPPQVPPKPSNESLTLSSQSSNLTLETLISTLPGRRTQILEILQLIAPKNSHMHPLLLYGGKSTGKTSTILQIFKHLNRHFVYASCRSCYSPRILFESVLNQLLSHRRCHGNGYLSAKRCERASEFVNLLRDAVVQLKRKIGSEKRMVYLVFDNVELIRLWDTNGSVLSLLFKINDILRIWDVGCVYISSSTPDGYYLSTGSIEPVTVYFPDYTVEDLHGIFMRKRENPKLYSSFLSVVLKPFSRISRRVDELSIALEPLFKKYCEPLTDLRVVPDEAMKRRLFDNIQPHLAAAINEMFEVPSWSSLKEAKEGTSNNKKWEARTIGVKAASTELEFHMPVSAKYLLLSAFLASRNPPTLDVPLFDSTGGSNNRTRKRKSSQASIDHQDAMAQEKLMKGSGSFPLERLLAIFQCITSVADDSFEEEFQEEGIFAGVGKIGLMSDVLLQLSTLCNANFLCRSGSCPLDGSARYRSTVDEEMALKVARSINFLLSKYLYRR